MAPNTNKAAIPTTSMPSLAAMPEATGAAAEDELGEVPPAELPLLEVDAALPVGVALEEAELALSVAVEDPLKPAVVSVPLALTAPVVDASVERAPMMTDVPDAVPVVEAEEDVDEHELEVPVVR